MLITFQHLRIVMPKRKEREQERERKEAGWGWAEGVSGGILGTLVVEKVYIGKEKGVGHCMTETKS